MAGKLADEDDLCKKMMEHFVEFKNSAEEYEIRYKRETGKFPPKMDPFLLRFGHREDHRKMCEQRHTFGVPLRTTVTNKAEVSFAPLNTLTRTTISDLRVNVTARGSYLLARTIEQPVVVVGIQTIIEDHTGDVFTFSVYHMFDHDLAFRPEDVLPLGTVFILKEPLLKTAARGSHIIRCDSPTDIVFVGADHYLFQEVSRISWVNEIEYNAGIKTCAPSNTEEWKKLGNEKFNKNMFREALEAYFMALKNSETSDKEMLIILNSNISAVFLKIGSFENGLLYARKALDLNPNHVKSLFRSGRAHYELRQYEEASHCFKMVMKLDPKIKESADEFAKCSSRLDEQKGNVDIYKLFLTKTHKPRTEIDCADFIGPIKVVEVPKKGRGVVATEFVKPGKLLCVSKALAVSFEDPLQGVTIGKKLGGKFSDNIKLVTKVAQKITNNPNVFGRLIYQLSSNDYVLPKVLFCDENSEKEPVADIEVIRKIVDTNCFGLRTTRKDENLGSALFHIPSYFNHSCLCNALWEPYNDVMVIHAVKPIACGEEICLTYHSNLDLLCEREANISNRGFRCLCLLCKLDRAERQGVHVRREQLIKSFDIFSNEDKIERVSVLRGFISDLERTYSKSGRSQLKCCLLPMNLHLSLALLKIENLEMSKECAEKALNAVGLCSNDLLIFVEQDVPLPEHSLVHPQICFAVELIAVYYFQSGRVQDAQRWVKTLLAFEKLFSGGDTNVAKMKYENLRVLLATVN